MDLRGTLSPRGQCLKMAERQGASKSVSFFPWLGRAPLKKRAGTQQLISERANQLGRGSLKNGNQRVTVN